MLGGIKKDKAGQAESNVLETGRLRKGGGDGLAGDTGDIYGQRSRSSVFRGEKASQHPLILGNNTSVELCGTGHI